MTSAGQLQLLLTCDFFRCGWGRNRTGDTRIFSPLLYQLSYPAARMLTMQQSVCRASDGGRRAVGAVIFGTRRRVSLQFRIFLANPPLGAGFSNIALGGFRSRRTAGDAA